MSVRRFYKEDGTWFIDLPSWPFDKAHLAMILGADHLLEKLSGHTDEVTLKFSTREPKEFDDVMVRREKLDGIFNGAVYSLRNESLGYSCDQRVDKNNLLWICGVTLWVFLRYPQEIYFKVV